MFATFLTSGVTDVDKMLRIYRHDGSYYVPFHEFLKSVMLGDRRFYKESMSPIMNVFDRGADRHSSHFTAIRLLRLLLSRRAENSSEGRGYVDISQVALAFEETFDNEEDFLRNADRLIKWQLIETDTRSTEAAKGASYIRVTSAGWYYVRNLVSSFAYLDLVLQDTPFSSLDVEREMRDSVFKVDNLSDRDEDKIARMGVRFWRIERFFEVSAR
jgi:hypothetical protein